jgi:hypothetical protein
MPVKFLNSPHSPLLTNLIILLNILLRRFIDEHPRNNVEHHEPHESSIDTHKDPCLAARHLRTPLLQPRQCRPHARAEHVQQTGQPPVLLLQHLSHHNQTQWQFGAGAGAAQQHCEVEVGQGQIRDRDRCGG